MTQSDSHTGQMAGARYRFADRLTADESFEVYLATQSTIARPVLLRIAKTQNIEHKEQLTREAKCLARFDQLPVARPIEIGTFKRLPFLALDVGGAEPAARWQDRPEESRKHLKSWMKSIQATLAELETAQLIVRDPTPEHWALGADGRAWLLDMTEAREAEAGEETKVRASIRAIERVAQHMLASITADSPEARAELDRTLAEVVVHEPDATASQMPASQPASERVGAVMGRTRARLETEWRRTPVRTLGLGFTGLALAIVAALITARAPSTFDPKPEVRGEVHYVLPKVTVTAIDPELVEARESAEAQKKYEALKAYRSVAQRDADQIEAQDLETLVDYLGLGNAGTRSAGQTLVHVGPRAEPALRAAFGNRSLASYHRRRAGEVLQALGARADLVPLWIEALDSKSCPARQLAAIKLAKSGDKRALEPLEKLADKDGWFRSYCGADEAELALDRLSDRLERS